MKMDGERVLAIAIETIGIVTVICGITLEALTNSPHYLILISIGSLVVAAGGMIWSKIMKQDKSKRKSPSST